MRFATRKYNVYETIINEIGAVAIKNRALSVIYLTHKEYSELLQQNKEQGMSYQDEEIKNYRFFNAELIING